MSKTSPSSVFEREEGEIVEDERDVRNARWAKPDTQKPMLMNRQLIDYGEHIDYGTGYTTRKNHSNNSVKRRRQTEHTHKRANARREKSKQNPKKRARRAFDARFRTVCESGGCGNTLLIRGAPKMLTMEEFRKHVKRTSSINTLRIRTAVLQEKRAFWLIYATNAAASQAFDKLYGAGWSLRCGLKFVVRPILHDDSEDSESRKRRRRNLALGKQNSDGDLLRFAGFNHVKVRPAAKALEKLLLSQPESCLFLKFGTTD